MMMASAFRRALPCFLPILMLVGCGDSGIPEVKQWMEQTKQQTKVAIPELSEPKVFEPYTYTGKASPDPFDDLKLAVAFAKMKGKSGNGLKPDLDRRREPLEAYPLDTIKMVGTLQKPGMSYAVVMVDKVVFQVRVGNYVGQNLGMVTKISENAVELNEIVQDASGDWVERKAMLELQEAKK